MAGTPTTRYGLPTMAGTDFIADINEWTASAMAAIDAKMSGYAEGTLAARPTSTSGSPGITGRAYRATDTGQWFLDTGTGWIDALGYRSYTPYRRHTGLLGTANAAGNYLMTEAGQAVVAGSNTALALNSQFRYTPADHSIEGTVTKWRLKIEVWDNSQGGSAGTLVYTAGVAPLGSSGSSSGGINVSPGTALGTVSLTQRGSGVGLSDTHAEGTDFNAPTSAGYYVVYFNINASTSTMAAGSYVGAVQVTLDMRHT